MPIVQSWSAGTLSVCFKWERWPWEGQKWDSASFFGTVISLCQCYERPSGADEGRGSAKPQWKSVGGNCAKTSPLEEVREVRHREDGHLEVPELSTHLQRRESRGEQSDFWRFGDAAAFHSGPRGPLALG